MECETERAKHVLYMERDLCEETRSSRRARLLGRLGRFLWGSPRRAAEGMWLLSTTAPQGPGGADPTLGAALGSCASSAHVEPKVVTVAIPKPCDSCEGSGSWYHAGGYATECSSCAGTGEEEGRVKPECRSPGAFQRSQFEGEPR